jgi:hypothetical protein
MNFAAVALVGFTLGQPPAPAPTSDYFPMNSRSIKLPIKYEKDRKSIRQVKLYVARNGENTWYQEGAVSPDRNEFTYVAKEDGIYWFTMVEEDLQGRNLPADLTRTPPDLKVLVDTVQPRVQFTTARRNGEEVVVEWFVDDKNPDENNTRVHFRPTGSEANWQEVTLPAGSKSGVRFPSGTTSSVTVRVTAVDLAGNRIEAFRDIGPNAATSQTSMSISPGATPLPTTPIPPAPTTPVVPAGAGGTPIPPPDFGPIPATGSTHPFPAAPMTPVVPPMTPVIPPSAPVVPPPASIVPPLGGTGLPGMTPFPTQPLPTVDPHPVVPATSPAGGNSGGPAPVAVWTGSPGNPTSPTVEMSRAQFINYLSFDMNYEVESRGPSGISRVDLWVTRDDGKTWLKWSQHDGKAPSVRVNLNVPANPQPEGTYGFRVVPVSGAGLSEREPVSGDAPDLRVVVDVTAPQLDLFPPVGDPTNPDTLVIQWKAIDKNFGDDPITIEWSDKPTGPWQPAAAASEVVQTGAGSTPQVRRLPNTGSFAWRVPSGLPPRVYLKVTARDAAGNVREVVTRDPILVDLVKPKAKISGIVTPVGGLVRP